MNDTPILYFGYGANRDPEMMKAIIGRMPDGEEAKISGFELCIQHWQEMTDKVRQGLTGSWDEHFRSYILRPAIRQPKPVVGKVWHLTPLERKLIDNWEMTGIWYNIFLLEYFNPQRIQVEIQVVNDPQIKQSVSGSRYKTFLNRKAKMLRVAKRCRQYYLKSQHN